jgi:hypothetical protein
MEKNLPLSSLKQSDLPKLTINELYSILAFYNDELDKAIKRNDLKAKEIIKDLVKPFLEECKTRLDARSRNCQA